jgi:SRSO17 transposase
MKQPREGFKTTVDTAQQWASGLEAVATRLGARFRRTALRQRAPAYLRGLISSIERKHGWQLAEAAGKPTPYGVQHVLGRAVWGAEAVRDDLRAYVVEHLGDAGAVLVVDETGFVKKGVQSVGVARQYSGTAGRVENCQIGVFLAYATKRGRTFLDRALYLPRQWAPDAARRAASGVPAAMSVATKPQLARRMIARALAGSVPCTWLTGDAVYGNDWRMRAWLEDRNLNDVLGVTAQYRIFAGEAREWATVVGRLPATAWQRHRCGAGSTGERVYDWARTPLRQLDTARQRWLLARRHVHDPTKITYYVASGPQETPLDALARVAGMRWAIEESFETAKGEGGLDQYAGRSWQGWYRHRTLALLAHAYLSMLRAQASAGPEAGGKSATSGRTARNPAPAAHRARGPAVGLGARGGGDAITASRHQVVPVAAYASSQSQVVSLQTPRRPVYASTTVVIGEEPRRCRYRPGYGTIGELGRSGPVEHIEGLLKADRAWGTRSGATKRSIRDSWAMGSSFSRLPSERRRARSEQADGR